MALEVLKDQLPKTGEVRLPFMSHLKELRDRLVYSAIAVGVGLMLGMIFGNYILRWLIAPAPAAMQKSFVAIEILENMVVYFKVSLTAGVILVMPFLVYQLFAFVAPGLTSKEKRFIFSILPAIVLMFLAGVAFAYYVALPRALEFLFSFNSNIATPEIRISNYIDLITRMLLVIGLVFETPLIIMGLARMGIVSPQWLAGKRRLWIVVAFVISAIITPTIDPVNQTIIAVPLILLLELGIFLARFVYKKKREVPNVQS